MQLHCILRFLRIGKTILWCRLKVQVTLMFALFPTDFAEPYRQILLSRSLSLNFFQEKVVQGTPVFFSYWKFCVLPEFPTHFSWINKAAFFWLRFWLTFLIFKTFFILHKLIFVLFTGYSIFECAKKGIRSDICRWYVLFCSKNGCWEVKQLM